MIEKQNRDAGALYLPGASEELIGEIIACKDLCHEYNLLRPSDGTAHDALLRRIFGKVGANACIQPNLWCDYGYTVTVGDNFFANHNLVLLDAAPITFGDNVFLGPDCGFYTSGHPIDYERRNQGLEYAWPITVGSNVWMGGGVRVMPGVTIGSDVVIGSGSVVTKDIPSGVVAAGNPCRVLRPITESDKATHFRWPR